MLNELIKKVNVLAQEMAKNPDLKKEYDISLQRTMNFISANNIPHETVIIIEDRICKNLLRKRIEDESFASIAIAKEKLENARKTEEWYDRAIKAGKGYAEAEYLEKKARLDDARTAVMRSSGAKRELAIKRYSEAVKICADAKSRFMAVGNADKSRLIEVYNIARAEREKAEKELEALSSGGMNGNHEYVSKSGEIAKALGLGVVIEEEIIDGIESEDVMEETTMDVLETLPYAEIVEEEDVFDGVEIATTVEPVVCHQVVQPAQPQVLQHQIVQSQPAMPDADVITKAVKGALADNDRFKFILEEVRFQASLEVVKIRQEVERVKNEAMEEVRKLMEELKRIKNDAEVLRVEANRAQMSAELVNKARTSATLNARRTAFAAKKTINAAKKAIESARKSQSAKYNY